MTVPQVGWTRDEEYDDEHCPGCGAEHVWHGRDEAQRLCPECRWGE